MRARLEAAIRSGMTPTEAATSCGAGRTAAFAAARRVRSAPRPRPTEEEAPPPPATDAAPETIRRELLESVAVESLTLLLARLREVGESAPVRDLCAVAKFATERLAPLVAAEEPGEVVVHVFGGVLRPATGPKAPPSKPQG